VDLALYTRVLWRFRLLVGVGILLGIFFAASSYYRIGLDGGKPTLTPRKSQTYQGTSTIFLSSTQRLQPYTDPGRYTGLAPLYAQFANSDSVKQLTLAKCGGLEGNYNAVPAADTSYGAINGLPMVNIFGIASTPGDAQNAADCATKEFLGYMQDRQIASQIPERLRVKITVIRSAGANPPQLIIPRKKTLPIVVFMAMLFATIGLAFILENARPAIRVVPGEGEAATLKDDRRSA
jgi:hypothetical protein